MQLGSPNRLLQQAPPGDGAKLQQAPPGDGAASGQTPPHGDSSAAQQAPADSQEIPAAANKAATETREIPVLPVVAAPANHMRTQFALVLLSVSNSFVLKFRVAHH